ncbi:hypothetical protein [Kaistia terrae]|uniref:Uncharacterized protein n=1 Tax=Kaistia terrae TaxID=537017 RepID=A0ABW0PTR3_9HYPH|nr:hypothetical protein [Kaistia terrae]MCX5578322.1 hypothetical protein [Kaistia terrae]
MRNAIAATGLSAGLMLAAVLPASAQTVIDGSATGLDPALVQSIETLVTRDFKTPAEARFKSLRLSKARNAHGYCGEVAVNDKASFVPFHAIIEPEGKPSLLLLSEHGGSVEDRETATRLLTNFGCVE